MLKMENVTVSYGNVRALNSMTIEAPDEGVVTIIGANGAGKTTCLRAISGLAPVIEGDIRFEGQIITKMPAHQIVGVGIAHVPEGRRIFPEMTVEENLRTGAYLRKDKDAVEHDLETTYIRFPRLRERRTQLAETMSGGEQQMLAIGRALMSSPKLLLMDEPSMGLSPALVEEIAEIIRTISQSGVPVILVEQNADLALNLARYAYVFEGGRLALEGPAKELKGNKHVRAAYLGD